MLTFSRFSKYGNLGNQLFQYASLIGLAKTFNTFVELPCCPFSEYLRTPPAIITDEQVNAAIIKGYSYLHIQEPAFHYDLDPFQTFAEDMQDRIVNITGWLQSPKYWQNAMDEVREALTFNAGHINGLTIQTNIDLGITNYAKTIAISIRRGDYVDNAYYELLPIEYYYNALFTHFPDWQDYKILIFSDDIEYCRVHFQCLPNAVFVDGYNPMQQLIIGSFCSNFIIANSTFSWWMAYLSELHNKNIKDIKVIRPTRIFAGDGLKNDIKDHYPPHWIPFEYQLNPNIGSSHIITKKIDLRDTTFIIPVSIDSNDRMENLVAVLYDNILRYFDTNVIIGEQGTDILKETAHIVRYKNFGAGKFHRTRMLNEMTAMATTPYIINYDCDMLTPPLQIYMAVLSLRGTLHTEVGEYDFVYPYDGRFARVDRTHWLPHVQKYKDPGIFRNFVFKGTRRTDGRSVGGAIAYNKETFIATGGENEKMISYAPEDQERFYRFKALGYRVLNIPGIIYHLDHQITMNSSTKHEDYDANEKEFTYVKSLTPAQLREYVNSWNYL